jgi:hypothetical protein
VVEVGAAPFGGGQFCRLAVTDYSHRGTGRQETFGKLPTQAGSTAGNHDNLAAEIQWSVHID